MIIENISWIYIKLIILMVIMTSIFKIPVQLLKLFKNYMFNLLLVILFYNYTKNINLTILYYLTYLLIFLNLYKNDQENFEATFSDLARGFRENTDLSPEQTNRKKRAEEENIEKLKKDLNTKKNLLIISEKFQDFADKIADEESKNLENEKKKLENSTGYLKINQEKVVKIASMSEKNATKNSDDAAERVRVLKVAIEGIESNLEKSKELITTYNNIENQDLEEEEQVTKNELTQDDLYELQNIHYNDSNNFKEASLLTNKIYRKITGQLTGNSDMINELKDQIKNITKTEDNEFLDFLNTLIRDEENKEQALTIYKQNLIKKQKYFKNKSYFNIVKSRIYKIQGFQFDSMINKDKKKKITNEFKDLAFRTLEKIQALHDEKLLKEKYVKSSEEIEKLYKYIESLGQNNNKEKKKLINEIKDDIDEQIKVINLGIKSSVKRKALLIKEVKSDKTNTLAKLNSLKFLLDSKKYDFTLFEELPELKYDKDEDHEDEDEADTTDILIGDDTLEEPAEEIGLGILDDFVVNEENVYDEALCPDKGFYAIPKYKSKNGKIKTSSNNGFYESPKYKEIK